MVLTFNRKLLFILLVGSLLRLIWVSDMGYKGDEKYTFHRTQKVFVTEPWPWLGMTSSVGTRNPGMSVWVFLLPAKVLGIKTPTGLVRVVQYCAILSLALLLWFFLLWLKSLEPQEQATWFWGLALAWVNPFQILIERKIWPQSMFPLFTALFLIGWWRRSKFWGAFIWGLVGMWLGQIHMSGFFFALAFFLGTLLFQRKAHWLGWITGSLLGGLTLLPWIQYLTTEARGSGFSFKVLSIFKFWTYFVTNAAGVEMDYSLGRAKFIEFMRYPLLGETPTYFVLVLHILVYAILVFLSLKFLIRLSGHLFGRKVQPFRIQMQTDWALLFTCLLFGILISLSGVTLHRHYLVIAFPLECVFLAAWVQVSFKKAASCVLTLLFICQLFISLNFLYYIHVNGGAPGGGYGITYQRQIDAGSLKPAGQP